MTLVVDASALAELLLARPAAAAVAEQFARHGYDLHAPHLLDVEVLSALRQVVARGDADTERAEQALEDLLDLPIERHGHDILAGRIWALRESFSAYDAAYVALAELVSDDGVSLLTADARLARAATAQTRLTVICVA
ncbi:MAG: PilT protein domain protein [Conexibacter sp.]|nr:PilT protein domain protein [Conexibacter sp.]